jgi:hypothetical protein
MENLFGIISSAVDSIFVFSKMTYICLPRCNKSEQRHEMLYEFGTIVTIEEIVTACMMEANLFFPHGVDVDVTDRT